jgi:hypothetical protein
MKMVDDDDDGGDDDDGDGGGSSCNKRNKNNSDSDELISKIMAPDRIKQYQLLCVCHRNYSKEILQLDQYKQ